jgi:hypothetical protein
MGLVPVVVKLIIPNVGGYRKPFLRFFCRLTGSLTELRAVHDGSQPRLLAVIDTFGTLGVNLLPDMGFLFLLRLGIFLQVLRPFLLRHFPTFIPGLGILCHLRTLGSLRLLVLTIGEILSSDDLKSSNFLTFFLEFIQGRLSLFSGLPGLGLGLILGELHSLGGNEQLSGTDFANMVEHQFSLLVIDRLYHEKFSS